MNQLYNLSRFFWKIYILDGLCHLIICDIIHSADFFKDMQLSELFLGNQELKVHYTNTVSKIRRDLGNTRDTYLVKWKKISFLKEPTKRPL